LPSPARIRSTIATITDAPADLRALVVMHKVLADPTRLRILHRLSHGEGTVGDLRRYVNLSQPLVSWHLRSLRAVGLVETQRVGREVICRLDRRALERYHELERQLLGTGGSS
jgi:DNA-binding transcriptional ArsR family regulator